MAEKSKNGHSSATVCLVNNWKLISNSLKDRAELVNYCVNEFRRKNCDSKQKIMVELMLSGLENHPKYKDDFSAMKAAWEKETGLSL